MLVSYIFLEFYMIVSYTICEEKGGWMVEEILYRYNPWWEGRFSLPNIIERPNFLKLMSKYLLSPQIVFLTGLRRVGKTTLFKLFIKHLLDKEKINPTRIFYVSLDDYLLSKKTILELVEDFRKIHKISFREKIFLFLDEIGYKEDFEVQLKNLYDTCNVKIYASSSSSTVLRSKKAYLTGRNIILEVLPLDFEEYLKFKNITITKADKHLQDRYFEDYLKTGGIPEYVLYEDIEYLKELVDDIIYKDIASFYKVKNISLLKDFFVLLMERAGKQFSINKMANILKISPDSARRYLQMFVDTYLIHLVQRYGKTNERLLSPKKIYASDLGIRVLFTSFRDKGSLFENYIYLKIKSCNPYYIYKEGIEIDFFIKNKILIEVKYDAQLSEKQLEIFKGIKADKKVVIKNLQDLNNFLQKL